jgi:hypothetical protein
MTPMPYLLTAKQACNTSRLTRYFNDAPPTWHMKIAPLALPITLTEEICSCLCYQWTGRS